jgi:hypothetical protein
MSEAKPAQASDRAAIDEGIRLTQFSHGGG